jgi:hypothetical protein
MNRSMRLGGALGIILGAAIGIALHNAVAWIGIGAITGMVFGMVLKSEE